MPPTCHIKMTISIQSITPQRNHGKNALSQKCLRDMIERGQSFHNSLNQKGPKPKFDNIDLHTEAEKSALLL